MVVAAGTRANTTYDREHPGTFQLDDRKEFYRGHVVKEVDGSLQLAPAGHRFAHMLQGAFGHQELRIFGPAVKFFDCLDFVFSERRSVPCLSWLRTSSASPRSTRLCQAW